MPRTELHVSDAAGTGSTALLPGPRWLWVLSNHTLFLYPASTCPRQKQCHSLLLQLDVTVQSHPWHKKACLRKHYCYSGAEWEERASGGNRGAHCLSPSRSPAPLLFPPPGPPSSLLPEQGEHGQMTERWFIIGLRQLQTGLALPQSTCKAA